MGIERIECPSNDFSIEKHLICVLKNRQVFLKQNLQKVHCREKGTKRGRKIDGGFSKGWLGICEVVRSREKQTGSGRISLIMKGLNVMQIILDFFHEIADRLRGVFLQGRDNFIWCFGNITML